MADALIPEWDVTAHEIAERDALDKDIKAREAAKAAKPAAPPAKPPQPAVVVPAAVKRVTLNPSEIADSVGRTVRLSAVAQDAKGAVLPSGGNWATTDAGIASITPVGASPSSAADIRLNNRGKATIIVNVRGAMAACHVVVN